MYSTQLLERPVTLDRGLSTEIGKTLNQARMILQAIRIDPDEERRETHVNALGELRARARRWQARDRVQLPSLLSMLAR